MEQENLLWEHTTPLFISGFKNEDFNKKYNRAVLPSDYWNPVRESAFSPYFSIEEIE